MNILQQGSLVVGYSLRFLFFSDELFSAGFDLERTVQLHRALSTSEAPPHSPSNFNSYNP